MNKITGHTTVSLHNFHSRELLLRFRPRELREPLNYKELLFFVFGHVVNLVSK